MLELNLQFFAKEGPGGEKTEEPTAKKLEDARKEGQVAKSKEVGNAAMLLAIFAAMSMLVSYYSTHFMNMFQAIYASIPDWIVNYQGQVPFDTITSALAYVIEQLMIILLPALLIGLVVPFVADVIQVGWKPTTKPLMPKFSKLNPVSGFKRIFSMNSLMELLKSILKIVIIIAVVWTYIRKQQNNLLILYDMSIMDAISTLGKMIITLGMRISIAYLFLALADFLYTKWKFRDDMKMTKQEVKDEFKNQEGDPQVKGKQRQRMQEASRRRMMQQLPQADVVITNPTHFAVAIKYDPEKYDAPYVVAKGADYLAAKIKEIARENNVEIVENKPLARMLYANVELGQIVPPELYQAVAEVLAFVYHLQGRA